jgi:hypothetical protein
MSKPIKDMNEKELKSLIGTIAYLQQFDSKSFRVTKQVAQKMLRERANITPIPHHRKVS